MPLALYSLLRELLPVSMSTMRAGSLGAIRTMVICACGCAYVFALRRNDTAI